MDAEARELADVGQSSQAHELDDVEQSPGPARECQPAAAHIKGAEWEQRYPPGCAETATTAAVLDICKAVPDADMEHRHIGLIDCRGKLCATGVDVGARVYSLATEGQCGPLLTTTKSSRSSPWPACGASTQPPRQAQWCWCVILDRSLAWNRRLSFGYRYLAREAECGRLATEPADWLLSLGTSSHAVLYRSATEYWYPIARSAVSVASVAQRPEEDPAVS